MLELNRYKTFDDFLISVFKALKEKQNVLIIATDGKKYETFLNGDNKKIISAICTAIDNDESISEIMEAVIILSKTYA